MLLFYKHLYNSMKDNFKKILDSINLKLIMVLLLVILFALNSFVFHLIYEQRQHHLKVTFLDVGQGDAILIRTPRGHKILIDAGPSGHALLRALSKELYFWERDFDMFFATHADKDHVGGFVDFLKFYQINKIYIPVSMKNKNNELSESLLELIHNNFHTRKSKQLYLKRGDRITFDDGVILDILFPPDSKIFPDSNTSSLILKVSYGDNSFILTGDAPKKVENLLALFDSSLLKAQVLKLGHHGSKTSSSFYFLHMVNPDYAVVSSGVSNRYGHPHKEVVSLAKDIGAELLNTANLGNINFYSDGRHVKLETKK